MFPAIIYMVLKGVFKNYNPEKNETVLYRLLVQKKKKKDLTILKKITNIDMS